MANTEAWRLVPPAGPEADIEDLFRARYLEMVRLAGLLGADDPEDIAQEAFVRLMNKRPQLGDPQSALPYLRAIVCNLTRNRHRHLRVVRRRTPARGHRSSGPQAMMLDANPPVSAVLGLTVPWTGKAAPKVVDYFWIGSDSPSFWLDRGLWGTPGASCGRSATPTRA